MGFDPLVGDAFHMVLSVTTLLKRGLPILISESAGPSLETLAVFTRRNDCEEIGLTYVLQTSSNMQGWDDVLAPAVLLGSFAEPDGRGE